MHMGRNTSLRGAVAAPSLLTMVCLAVALLILSHVHLQLPMCAAAPLDQAQTSKEALLVMTSEDAGGASNLANIISKPDLVRSKPSSGQQAGQRAGSQPKKPCIDLPPVPTFSQAFCRDVQAQLANCRSDWQSYFSWDDGPSEWYIHTAPCDCNQYLVPANCSHDYPGSVGPIRYMIAMIANRLNPDQAKWTKLDDVPDAGLTTTNCYACHGCTPPITLSTFPSECNGNRFNGIFFPNVHDGAQGLCCESDTHRYCMTLDSNKPTCCEGINPATSKLTHSIDAVIALILIERVAPYAYYDIWGYLTIGVGFATTGDCYKPQQYSDTMCLSKAYDVLTACLPKYAKLVKEWMTKQGIKCINLPQNVFDALVVLKYNCGTACWPRLVKPLKDEDWEALAAAIASDPKASNSTKKYVVQLIQKKLVVNLQEDVSVRPNSTRCHNSQCKQCGADAWEAAKSSAKPKLINITIPPDADKNTTEKLEALQKMCNKCIKALRVVKGPGGCSKEDRVPKKGVPCGGL